MSADNQKPKPAYLIFDVEAIADGELVSKIRYPNLGMSGPEALARYRAELLAENGKDILPTTFMLPVSVAIAKVDAE
ncbi:MAG TPA: 3'-5' exonuclease, partial [Planctomycetaceae bacterium]|nr:3'-5' exonuclease [Planctomycetaceae bacterium]